METDKPKPEPEPEVDASVEEVCVLIVNIVGFPFIQNVKYLVGKNLNFTVCSGDCLENSLVDLFFTLLLEFPHKFPIY